MASELTTFFDAKVGEYTNLAADATAQLGAATAELAEANGLVSAAVKAIAVLDGSIAQLREDASGDGLTPADIEDLADSLRAKLIERRNESAELAGLKEQVADAQRRQAEYRTRLAAYQAGLARCSSGGTDAAVRAAQHEEWFSADTTAAVGEWVAASETLLAEVSDTPDPPADPESEEAANRALIAAANARVEADIPEVLRERARTRATTLVDGHTALVASLTTSVEDENATYRAAHNGDQGALDQHWLAYERAEAVLRGAALGLGGRTEHALGLLRSVRDSTALTAAESARITEVALAADADAIVTEAALDTVQAAVRAKQVELELAILAALIADPVADPADDATVQARQGELDTLTGTDLPAAEAAHTAALALELDTWEVAVPNSTWAALVNYDTAIDLLTAIAGTDIGALRTVFSSAETQLVAALEAEETKQQVQAFTGAAVTAARARAKYFNETHAARLASTVRGDK